MSSCAEIEKKLKALSPPVSPEIATRIAAMHKKFHDAGSIDETVPYSFNGANIRNLVAAIQSMEPTNLAQGLELFEELCVDLHDHGGGLDLIGKIYFRHRDPNKLDHGY